MTILVAAQRVLQSRPATVTATFEDQEGSATAPSGSVTVHAVRVSTGADVLVAGTAATVDPTTHVVSAALTVAETALLDWITCTWTDAAGSTVTTTVEVVGGYYVGLADIRAQKNIGSAFADGALIEARRWFEDKFEEHVGAAMVPRFRQVVVWGDGTDHLQLPGSLPRKVRAVSWGTVSLGAQALSNLVAEGSGLVTRYWPLLLEPTDDSLGIWSGRFPEGFRVTVGYEHGLDRPAGQVRDAALVAIRDKLLTDNTGSRHYATVTDIGTVLRTSTPGPGRPFGIPYVDEIANEAKRRFGLPEVATVQIG